jgi:hypothetical protein
MDTEILIGEIRRVFPIVDLPTRTELRFHADECPQCEYLADHLDENRGKPVNGPMIRYMHQELSCLSAKGWAWMLPHYLPYCLTPEAEYNQMETEFLLYNLAPDEQFAPETRIRLSALSPLQLHCLVHFVEWMRGHPKWSEYCPSEISRALQFLGAIYA